MSARRSGSAGPRSGRTVLAEVLERIVLGSRDVTRAAPHVRAPVSTDRVLRWFVIASLPAVLVGAWSLGAETSVALSAGGSLGGLRGAVFGALGADSAGGSIVSLAMGLSYWLPLFAVALIVCLGWEVVFATSRRRPVDPGVLMTAWVFSALLPATMPLTMAAIGISFGVVLGSHIFGGTGRYLVSPALLAVVFLTIAYPDLFDSGAWLPVEGAARTWSLLAEQGVDGLVSAGRSWTGVFAGREIGALGAPSALACLAGSGLLIARGAASWRTIAGALIGSALALYLLSASDDPAAQIPWRWQLATGYFAFGLAFVATDPTTTPLTAAGRWLHGGMFGALVVLIRVANPEHPEGTLLALVLASLFTPLVDHIVVAAGARSAKRARSAKTGLIA